MATSGSAYLLAGQLSELERLQIQSRVWEPAGRALLDRLGGGQGLRTLDVGCGCLGWLRLLSQWVGPDGSVTGIDVDAKLLDAARALIKEDRLGNVTLVHDDLFDSKLEPHTFNLVHSRFEIGPLGRAADQLASYLRLVAPGGWVILEDPDLGSWHFNPPAPAAERLITLRSGRRSTRLPPDIPTCAFPCSSACPWNLGCSGSFPGLNLRTFGNGPRPRSVSRAVGAPRSRWCRPGLARRAARRLNCGHGNVPQSGRSRE